MHTSCNTSPTLEIRTPVGALTVLSRSTPHRRRIDTGAVRATLPGMRSGCRRQHTPPPPPHTAHRRHTAYGHDCGTNRPETSSQPSSTILQKIKREHKGYNSHIQIYQRELITLFCPLARTPNSEYCIPGITPQPPNSYILHLS
ncbi:hypothetical protein TcasGA2_TC014176 [Tribolium castaneum]|uniref:Uncharacterized protein n=1 Tax=Tribolium castaneum TaxID=7070 RepID=D6W6V7_TRICA|nr:hypothetical protein TcasGA2_TC014176 [Tribolium castaneum]